MTSFPAVSSGMDCTAVASMACFGLLPGQDSCSHPDLPAAEQASWSMHTFTGAIRSCLGRTLDPTPAVVELACSWTAIELDQADIGLAVIAECCKDS